MLRLSEDNKKSLNVLFYIPGEIDSINLGVGYLVSYLRKHGHCHNFIYQDNILTPDSGLEIIKKFKPDIIAISSSTRDFSHVCEVSASIKEKSDALIFLGGAHISASPETLPMTIDVGFIGEAEKSFLSIFDSLKKGKLLKTDLSTIPNLAFYNDSLNIVVTKKEDPIKDLDEIPPPAWDIYPNVVDNAEAAHIITSRGCPFNCSFCQAKVLSGNVRMHSAKRVVEEIKELNFQYGAKKIHINDDLFTQNIVRLKELRDLFISEGMQEKVILFVNGRANLIDEELIFLLKQLNCSIVGIGLESMSQKVLSRLKDNVTVNDNLRAIDLLCKNNILVGGLFILGTPFEGFEDLEVTYRYLKKNRRKFGAIVLSIATPLPRTKLWDYCHETGQLQADVNDISFGNLSIASAEVNKKLYIGAINIDEFYQYYILISYLTHSIENKLDEKDFPDSLKINLEQLSKNYLDISCNKSFFEQVRGGYPVEQWEEGNIFWTNGGTRTDIYLRHNNKEKWLKIRFYSIIPKSVIEFEYSDMEIGVVIGKKEMYLNEAGWFTVFLPVVFPVKQRSPCKLSIKSQYICLHDFGLSIDRRNLGIAVAEIKLCESHE